MPLKSLNRLGILTVPKEAWTLLFKSLPVERYIDDCFASSFTEGGSKNRALVRALAWRQCGILGMIAYGRYSAHENCTTGDLFLRGPNTSKFYKRIHCK